MLRQNRRNFFLMLGVGIHAQSWYNWLFFVGVAHWCGLIHAFTKSLTFDVHSFKGPVAQSCQVSTQFDALLHREGDVLDFRVHRLARRRSHLFLHLPTFLAMYFVKNKHLDQASEHKAFFFKDEVSVSSDAVHLRHWLHWV